MNFVKVLRSAAEKEHRVFYTTAPLLVETKPASQSIEGGRQ